jgi:hypothetical protein
MARVINFEDIEFGADDQGGYVQHDDFGRFELPPELATAIAAQLAIAHESNEWARNRTPLMVVQHPETGLVTGIYRAQDVDVHDKAKEKLGHGRILTAVVQHFALHEEAFEIIHHEEPDAI